jgi:hypothetical protein
MGASRVSPRRVTTPCHRRVTDYHCRVTCLEQNIVERGVSAVTLQEEERSLTDAKLEMLFPSVPWRDPIRISDDGDFGFACRFCIARYGIRDGDMPSLSMSAIEVRRHIREHHPWSVGGDKRIRRRRKR